MLKGVVNWLVVSLEEMLRRFISCQTLKLKFAACNFIQQYILDCLCLRSAMGVMESWCVYVHSLCRYSSENGRTYRPSKVSKFGFLDSRTSCGQYVVIKKF
jgi:hypothetical protein